MLDKELDKLRDKTLSFGCIVECENNYSYIISHHVNRNENQIKSIDGFVYKLLSINQFGENIHSDYNNLGGYKIIGHPLTRGRISKIFREKKVLEMKSDGTKIVDETFWKLYYLMKLRFDNNVYMYDKTELERMQSPHREELKKLLIEFSNYL